MGKANSKNQSGINTTGFWRDALSGIEPNRTRAFWMGAIVVGR
jgi:hypothetical protein